MITVELHPDYLKRLRRRLKRLGITHGALARELGVESEQVARWINRGVDPRISSVIRIEQAIRNLTK